MEKYFNNFINKTFRDKHYNMSDGKYNLAVLGKFRHGRKKRLMNTKSIRIVTIQKGHTEENTHTHKRIREQWTNLRYVAQYIGGGIPQP